ncbi:hypothetical protein DFQ27_007018 [Actinomortierella ambigua]|uniref:LysM domain-containing protein n=1 Tax=Actinomortierella ambigua TaxID=1343610 RepID=A0A9P6U0P7_9FUNG|nr:hypothetical protein DFQ27_007018 [Actinomortierella ambigua]
MKFTLSVAVLALAASQAMAVVPTPVASCKKSVIIQPSDGDCVQFRAKWNIPDMETLRAMNLRLLENCMNLDVGAPICVATVGPSQPPITPSGAPMTSGAAVPTVTGGPAPTQPPNKSGAVTVPTGATNSVSSTALPAGASRGITPTHAPTGAAVANKGSFLVAAAGVILSAAYIL